jgi:hypothetical protein
MDGNILATGGFEVMLSKGLGRHFAPDEKERLFQDAKHISDLLATVMDRRTREPTQGEQRNLPPMEPAQNPGAIKKALEKLGEAKRLRDKSQWLAEGGQLRPGLRRLRPEDLPPGVTASAGYDHRGTCYVFEHRKLGELGRIVLSQVRERETLMKAELYEAQEKQASVVAKKKRELFKKVVAAVSACFN